MWQFNLHTCWVLQIMLTFVECIKLGKGKILEDLFWLYLDILVQNKSRYSYTNIIRSWKMHATYGGENIRLEMKVVQLAIIS